MADFELQSLIHALDRGEQTRFREISDEDAHYFKLYESLKESELVPEEGFKRDFRGHSFMERYSFNKGYLLDKLMDAMRSQRKRGGLNKLIHQQVAEWIEDAEFLHEHLMIELCNKRLKKAEKEARTYELHEELIKILRFRCRILVAGQEKGYDKTVRQVLLELKEISRIIANKQEIFGLRLRLFTITRISPETREEATLSECQEIASHQLLSSPNEPLSFEARLNFEFCHALLSKFKGDEKAMHSHYKNIYDLWVLHPQFRKSRPTDYRTSLNNYLIICCATNTFDDFTSAVNRMEKGPFRSEHERMEVYHSSLYVRLHFFMAQGLWEDASEIEAAFSKDYESFSHRLIPSRKLAFWQSFARLNLITGNYEQAAVWNEEVIKMRLGNVRRDLFRHALLFSMIVFYELGNIPELENRYRAIIRAFSKENLILDFEQEVLTCLKRLPRIQGQAELHQELSFLLEKIEAVREDQGQRQAQGFEIIRYWLLSKVHGIDLKEAIAISTPSNPDCSA